MSPYLLLIFDFLPARLATLPYGLDSIVTQLLANLLTKPSVFYYFANCILYLVSKKNIIIINDGKFNLCVIIMWINVQ